MKRIDKQKPTGKMVPSTGITKICFIAPKAYPLFNPAADGIFGGTEVDLYLLATELAKDKSFEVSFIAADYGQKPVETINEVRIFKSLNFNKNPLFGALKVWRTMKTIDAQIYFLQGVSLGTSLVATFCKLHNRKFVYRTAHTHACDGTYLKQHYFKGRIFRWSLRKAKQVVVQNNSDKENIKRTIGVNSMVIPNGHHLPALPESKRNIILWVGRSSKLKRPHLFIELAEKFPDEKFTLVCQQATGDRNYDQLIARARQVKNLEFIQRVQFNEIDSYFQRAKLFVCTSKGEGFPNTYVQACKNAAPILSLCVNPDDFLNRYKCGMCANDNWDAFLKHLKTIIKPEKMQEYGKYARKYAEEKHDIKKIVQKYKELFARLVSDKT